MPTPNERKALLFFGFVIVLGAGARAARIHRAPGVVNKDARNALDTQIAAADSARHAKFKKTKGHRKSRVPTPQARVDLDIASEQEIEALRGVGPSLARRIVAQRDSFGPFGSIDGLKRVRGVGAGLVAKLDSTVTFSLLPRPMNTVITRGYGRPETPNHRFRNKAGDTLR